MRRGHTLLALVLVLVFLGMGCAPKYETSSTMPDLEPPQEEEITEESSPGSLFQSGKSEYLFADNRARRTGDIVLVNIVENSSAESGASTTADSESEVDLGLQSFLGQDSFLGVPGTVGEASAIQAGSTKEFDSDGSTERSAQVTATVAARVVDEMSNGLMQVRGAREVRVNGENQIVAVSGLIRSRDIASNNSISSDQLADAKIEFYGRGVLADKQKPGWMTRFLDNAWPF
ncbi:MAG: flagellar basal body L-ring protein FlgH [Desulfohalobiaceae bacterium]